LNGSLISCEILNKPEIKAKYYETFVCLYGVLQSFSERVFPKSTFPEQIFLNAFFPNKLGVMLGKNNRQYFFLKNVFWKMFSGKSHFIIFRKKLFGKNCACLHLIIFFTFRLNSFQNRLIPNPTPFSPR